MRPIPAEMHAVIDPLPTKAEKIRVLDQHGFERADIARFLDIRYQHVRNVLERSRNRRRKVVSPDEPDAGATAAAGPVPLGVDQQGRVVVPPEMRAAMMLGDDGKVTAWIEDGELHLITPRVALRRLRQAARKLAPEGMSVVDEFISDKRREAERE